MVEYFGDDEAKTPTNKKGGDLSPEDPLEAISRRLFGRLTTEQVLKLLNSKEWAGYAAKTAFDLEAIHEAGKAFEKDSHDR